MNLEYTASKLASMANLEASMQMIIYLAVLVATNRVLVKEQIMNYEYKYLTYKSLCILN